MADATTQTQHATGTFCWNELLTSNVDAAKKFYTEVLGWTTREMDMGPAGTYTILVNKGTDIGGIFSPPDWNAPSSWMSYIAVDDVDASTSKAEKHGAKLCYGPQDIPNVGRFSMVTDPAGATIAFFQRK